VQLYQLMPDDFFCLLTFESPLEVHRCVWHNSLDAAIIFLYAMQQLFFFMLLRIHQ